MTWLDLSSEVAELFTDHRREWSDGASVFTRALPRTPASLPEVVIPGPSDWALAAMAISRTGKVDHRIAALRLLASGVSIRRAARLLAIDDKTVRRWAQAARAHIKEAA